MVKLSDAVATKPGSYMAIVFFDGEDADFYMWDDGTAELQLSWKIDKVDAETVLTVKGYEQQCAWTGSGITPKVQVYVPWQEEPPVEGRDYSVSYSANINVGAATITISPNQNYFNGNKSVEFEIVEGTTPEPNPVVRGAWRGGVGKWWYQYNDGSLLKSCWKDIDGKRYYFDVNGYAKAGWRLLAVLGTGSTHRAVR